MDSCYKSEKKVSIVGLTNEAPLAEHGTMDCGRDLGNISDLLES